MIAMNHRLVSHGGQPLRAPRRRRHPGAHPDGLRHRHDRREGRQPRRPRHRPRPGAGDARRRRGHRARLPPGAGAARLVGLPARCSRTSGPREGERRHPPHEPRPRAGGPPAARRRERLPHDHRRQADHLPADGRDRGGRACASSSATRGPAARPRRRCPGSRGRPHLLARRRAWPTRERDMAEDQLVCECELLPRRAARGGGRGPPGHEPRRRPRGCCGSGWARARAASAPIARPGSSTASAIADAERADELVLMFLQHRWQGLEPILYGDQMRQAVLDDWIFQGILDVEHLPAELPARPGMTQGRRRRRGPGRARRRDPPGAGRGLGLGRRQGRGGPAPVAGHHRRAGLRARAGRRAAGGPARLRRRPPGPPLRAPRPRAAARGPGVVPRAGPGPPLRRRSRAQHAPADGRRRRAPDGPRARRASRPATCATAPAWRWWACAR